jgi:putative ABC transport system permease protein
VSSLRVLWTRIRGFLQRNPVDQFDEEIEAHAELLHAAYIQQGMTETEARYAALRELGNVTRLREEYREQKGLPLIEAVWQDLKYALRTLRRNAVFTVSSMTTLGIGLGVMIAVLCVVSALLWRPLPYPNPERLITLNEVDPRNGLWPFSEPTLLDVKQQSNSLASVAGYQSGAWALTGSGEPEAIPGARVTPSFFQMFGVAPIAGRVFHESKGSVVIGRALWKSKWGMDPHIVGRAIALDGEDHTVAGVADLPGDLLPGAEVLLQFDPKATESRSAHEIEVVGRLQKDIGIKQAAAELNAVAARIARENPRTNAGWGMMAAPLFDQILGPRTGRMLWVIFAAVAMLWLLACVNVAGLQLARSVARRHEMGTRLALGASRGRLLGLMLTESAVLVVGGTLLGLGIADWLLGLIRSFAAESVPRMAHARLNGSAIGIALGCMVVSIFLSAIFPGKLSLFQGSRGISRRDRGHDVLIIVQVALASVLVVGASLLLHSFLRLRAVDPGFDPERILSVRVTLPARGYDDARKTAFFRETDEHLKRLPEVEAAGATNIGPFSGIGTANRFRVEGEPSSTEYRSAAWRAVTPGFFNAMRIPLKAGRLFSDADADGSLEVVILSESMAKKFWPNQDPIGKRLLWGRSGNPKTVVGIVGDLRDLALDQPPVPTMFRPYAQLSDRAMTEVIRTRGDPAAAAADVRREMWSVDRNAALEFKPLRRALSDSILRPRASLAVVTAFALVALVIAAFGLYALISYHVNQRQRETGIRLALGAPAGSVRWSVQRRCLLLVCSGLAIGLPCAYVLSRLMRSLLYETQPAQAGAYALVLFVFAAVSLAASYPPARRASRMDPAAAIRHE